MTTNIICIPMCTFNQYKKGNTEILPEILEFNKHTKIFFDHLTSERNNVTKPTKIVDNMNICGILNKAVEENIDLIFDELMELGDYTRDNVELLVSNIVDRASMEPLFINAYIKMLFKIHASLKLPEDCPKLSEVLASKCKKVFDMYITTDNHDKKRRCGFMRLFGQLFVNEIFTQNVINTCIMNLLNDCEKINSSTDMYVKLITTVLPKFNNTTNQMDEYAKILNSIIAAKRLNKRETFMTQGVLDDIYKKYPEIKK